MVANEVEWDDEAYCRIHRKEKERDEDGKQYCDECIADERQARRARAQLRSPKRNERFPFADVSQERARQILLQGHYFKKVKGRLQKMEISEHQRWWLERRSKGLV